MEQSDGATAPRVRIALLDHDGVYWPPLLERALGDVVAGDIVFCDRELAELLPEGAIYVDRNCDLAGGQYTWNGEAKSFIPLPRHRRKESAGVPTLEQAFYDLITEGPSAPRVQAWCVWFKQSLDERGAK